MAGPNYFDQFDAPHQIGVPIAPADPRRPSQIQQSQADAQRAAAEAPFAGPTAAARLREARANATLAEQKARDAAAAHSLVPTANVHGDDYLKGVDPSTAAIVRAVDDGRMQLPAFALRTPYWQNILQHVANYDPSFDTTDFNARNKARADFGPNGRNGQAMIALNTALLHAGNLQDAIQGLGNKSGILGRAYNAIGNLYDFENGDPRITNFIDARHKYSEEGAKILLQSGAGTGAERQEGENQLGINNSPAQLLGTLGTDARMYMEGIRSRQFAIRQALGPNANIQDFLSPEALAAYHRLTGGNGTFADEVRRNGDPLGGIAIGGGAVPPAPLGGTPPRAGGTAPPGGAPTVPGASQSWRDMPSSDPQAPATGGYRKAFDPVVAAQLSAMVHARRSPDEINAYLSGIQHNTIDPKAIMDAESYAADHPDWSPASAYKYVPTTGLERAAASAPGAYFASAANGVTAGNIGNIAGTVSWLKGDGFRQGRDTANANLDALSLTHPVASGIGNVTGGALSTVGVGGILGRTAAGAKILARLPNWVAPSVGGATYGGIYGASTNPDDPLGGSIEGASFGVGGALVGSGLGTVGGAALRRPLAAAASSRPSIAAINVVRNILGREPLASGSFSSPQALSPAENIVASGAQKAGPDSIYSQLADAQRLGVPMTLADTSQNLSSVAGAAVRRSPAAADFADGVLRPRSLGQIDRFGTSLESNLGPTANVPNLSDSLSASAKAKAAPLYDSAYSFGQVNDPALNELLQHPGLKAAYDAAQSLRDNDAALARARGEPEPPQLTQAYTLDAKAPNGFRLTTPPDVRTIDYIKRGLDQRIGSAYSGSDSQAAMNLPFLRDARSLLLNRTDAAVPAYGAARAAYAGPMQEADALNFGRDAVSMDPDALSNQMGSQPPGVVPHIQLGYRSGMMGSANRARFVSNPFDTVLGSPAAEARLNAVFPDNQTGVANMLQTRDMEGQLARTTNDILGNSKTAQRGIADQAFGSDVPQLALDAGVNLMTGQVPTSLFLKKGAGQWLKDAWQMGVGSRAVAKADQLAPIVLNPSPSASADTLSDILNRAQGVQDWQAAWRQRFQQGGGGMFGAALAQQSGNPYGY